MFDHIPWPGIIAVAVGSLIAKYITWRREREIPKEACTPVRVTEGPPVLQSLRDRHRAKHTKHIDRLLANPMRFTGGNARAMALARSHPRTFIEGYEALDASPDTEAAVRAEAVRALALARQPQTPPPAGSDDTIDPTDLEEAARTLVYHRVISEADGKRALTLPAPDMDLEWLSVRWQSACAVLARLGRLIMFDLETGMWPNEHDDLVLEFAAASAGTFQPTCVLQTVTPPDFQGADTEYAYTLEFIHDGWSYKAHPKHLGDWYDVEAVLQMIHRALDDIAERRRFCLLDTGGQCVIFAFTTPKAWKHLMADLGPALA